MRNHKPAVSYVDLLIEEFLTGTLPPPRRRQLATFEITIESCAGRPDEITTWENEGGSLGFCR